ncbi:MAG: DUF433 domain-containing protein [Anaerolineales bacterium]|nr:DUF433 domain-containing protein [Anaerolineales bacterium]
MTAHTAYKHIVSSPDVAGGKPRIEGRRITVQHIAVWHEHLGYSVDEIATQYDLALAEVYGALAYYFDHKDEIDEAIARRDALVDSLQRQTPSRLARKLCERPD